MTVTPVDDADGQDEAATIAHSAADGGYDGVSQTLTASVTDDDTNTETILDPDDPQQLLPARVNLTEGDTAFSYKVALAEQPSTDVTITVTTGSGSVSASRVDSARAFASASGTGGAVTISPSTLTFTTSNWNTPQALTLTPVDDDDATDERVDLTLQASGGNYDGASATLKVSVKDDDVEAVVLSSRAVTVPEGTTASYTVKLATEPTGDVTVTVTATGDDDLTASLGTLTFKKDNLNWNTPQTVTLAAAEDPDWTDGTATVTHTGAGGGYAGVTAALSVREADNDKEPPTFGERDGDGPLIPDQTYLQNQAIAPLTLPAAYPRQPAADLRAGAGAARGAVVRPRDAGAVGDAGGTAGSDPLHLHGRG